MPILRLPKTNGRELAEKILKANMPRASLRGAHEDSDLSCVEIEHPSGITITRELFESCRHLPVSWHGLPYLRYHRNSSGEDSPSYLIEFSEERLVLSSEPPEGASDEEKWELLHRLTSTWMGEILERRKALRLEIAMAEKAAEAGITQGRNFPAVQSAGSEGVVTAEQRQFDALRTHVRAWRSARPRRLTPEEALLRYLK